MSKRILITGTAGFIGSAIAEKLLIDGLSICGIDNHNSYYDVTLKEARVSRLNIYDSYQHHKKDILDLESIQKICKEFKPEIILHLAAQPGVRYSLENPMSYIDSNLRVFANILELSKSINIDHLIFASSSSVYGNNNSIPYSENDNVDKPLNLYAATKKSNELMSYAYSHLYNIPITGLRFFTVYGPWGRPDMAPMILIKSIMEGKKIKVHNHGNHSRDFTYIGDIVNGLDRVILKSSVAMNTETVPWNVYNIGSGEPIQLMDFINQLESSLGVIAEKDFIDLQPGEMIETYANMEHFEKAFGKIEMTKFSNGIQSFVDWYTNFYKV